MTLGFHLSLFTSTEQVIADYPWQHLGGLPHVVLDG